MRIVLASQSAARKRAMDMLGLQYCVIPSDFDEQSIRDDDPYALARKLSEAKAKALDEQGIIIAGDLFVVFDGKIYEKPKDEAEAFDMLKKLSGNSFDIIAGIAVYNSESGKMLSSVESCQLTFRELTDEEIHDYIANYPVTKFSAAFDYDGILRFGERVQGNLNFSTGIPINKLILFLREHGVKV